MAPPGGKCSYTNCTSTQAKNGGLSFFSFPVKDKERCIQWIVSTGRDDLCELPQDKLKFRRVCSKHFPDSAFANSSRSRLLRNHPDAVPIPWFNYTTHENSTLATVTNDNNHSTPQLQKHISHSPQVISNKKSSQKNDGGLLDEFVQDFQPLRQTPEKTPSKCNNPCEANLTSSTNVHTPRKKKLINTISQQKIKLKSKLNSLAFMKRRKPKCQLSDILSVLPKYISGEPLEFLTMQLRHQKKTNWTENEKNLALSLYYKSPSVYRLFRQRGYKLPCFTTIKKSIGVTNLSPGFTNEVFSRLKTKTATMTDNEKQCILVCDEMSIKKGLQYNQKLDIVEGFEDLGVLGRTGSVATHALVFMLRGLKHQWKCPIAYTLSNNSVKSPTLALLIEICIEKVINTGLNLKAIISDLGSTNAAAMKLLGVKKTTPHYTFGDTKILCLFDFPHLLKCVRNNLLKHDITADGKTISWGAIQEFYELDRNSKTDCRAAPKLSQRHLNPNSFEKMSVKVAAQIFSSSVSRGMKAAKALKVLHHPSCEATADFIGTMNDLTDSMNSKHLNDRNQLKRPLSHLNTKSLSYLKETIPYVESWSINGKKPPCFDALVQTIKGVLMLFENVVRDQSSFLFTGRLNQDCLENLFGVLRQRNGYNINPSAAEFRRSLQQCMTIRLMTPPGTNCEPDNDEFLDLKNDTSDTGETDIVPSSNQEPCDSNYNEENSTTSGICDLIVSSLNILNSSEMHDEGSIETSEDCIINSCQPIANNCAAHEDENNLSQVTTLEDNVICYIAGWLAKRCVQKFKCDSCQNSLLNQNHDVVIDRENLLFIKSFTCHTGEATKLNKPSNELYQVVKHQMHLFAQEFQQNISNPQIHKTIKLIMENKTTDINSSWWKTECRPHRTFMMDLLIRCKLFYSVKWLKNDIRDSALRKIRPPPARECVKERNSILNIKN